MWGFNIDQFIRKKIIKRDGSLFAKDLAHYHHDLTKAIQNKTVLVIGGAGTIGSNFIKALLAFKPQKLCVVDTNENGLTELTRDLRSQYDQFIPSSFKTYPMNFGDPVFKKMFVHEGPFDIVANFAAHKHVRSEKDQYAIEAMIENNILKAYELLDLLMRYPPEHFFCVSTDKAANPVNVMGASKKLMEEIIMSYHLDFNVTTARFANVAFSNGSLLDGYLYRLMKKQPLSCPADVKRFFVSPEESGQICLLACVLGNSGDIFFPKLNEEDMLHFKTITEDFLTELGVGARLCNSEEEAKWSAQHYVVNSPYPVYFFPSDTTGEKLYEEFFTAQDELDLTSYAALGVIKNSVKPEKNSVQKLIMDLKTLVNKDQNDKTEFVFLLKKYLPSFEHIETGKNLDHKM